MPLETKRPRKPFITLSMVSHVMSLQIIGHPVLDKGTSVVTLTTAATAMFPNADDHLRNWVENPSQYN